MPITATASLARRIDRTELAMLRLAADAGRAMGAEVQFLPAGAAGSVFCGPGSPFNKLIAFGFGDLVDEAEWQALEDAHAARGVRVQVELATLADPVVASTLTARGYRLTGFENVLARRLDSHLGPPDTAIVVSPSGADEFEAWMDVVTTGFLHPDTFDGPASHESFDRAEIERAYRMFAAVPGMARSLAHVEATPAGGASVFLGDGVALLCGAATLPAFRRRGVQSALLHARLAEAARAGCELAVVTTQPGSKSQENVQRAGFELIYSRAVLVKG